MHSIIKPGEGQIDITESVNNIRALYKEYEGSKNPMGDFLFLREITDVSKAFNFAAKDPAILAFLENPEHAIGYCGFKASVIRALGIQTVCEIGIGLGVSAFTFAQANPRIEYTGIDNGENDGIYGYPLMARVEEKLKEQGIKATILCTDSQLLSALPEKLYDMVYVDGNHSRGACCHDVMLAWDSEAEWILVDDTHCTAVAAGVWDALYNVYNRRLSVGGLLEWTHFPNTWTGNILIRRKRE